MVSRLLERGNFDDKEEAINKRCATFQNECRPVLEKYADKLLKVNADQDKEAVAQEIEKGFWISFIAPIAQSLLNCCSIFL